MPEIRAGPGRAVKLDLLADEGPHLRLAVKFCVAPTGVDDERVDVARPSGVYESLKLLEEARRTWV